ncbi:MAG: helicase associated domain-containing protein [bacterium]
MTKIIYPPDPPKIPDNWMRRYCELKKFLDRYGRFPSVKDAQKSMLMWVCTQRVKKRQDRLTSAQLSLLNKLSFDWDPHKTRWLEQYTNLKKFISDVGRFPARAPKQPARPNEKRLAEWCIQQRRYYKQGKLSSERQASLTAIKFNWQQHDFLWEEYYTMLTLFKKEKRCWPKSNDMYKDGYLGRWCVSQRRTYKHGTLSQSRIRLLDKLGFDWSPHDTRWEHFYSRYLSFIRAYNRPPARFDVFQGNALGAWCSNQRQARNKGLLSAKNRQLLDAIGFDWGKTKRDWQTNWDSMYLALKEYMSTYHSMPKKGHLLSHWCQRQRQAKKTCKLTQDRIKALDDIGFSWSNYSSWQQNFELLRDYIQQYQHMPDQRVSYKEVRLGAWAQMQRMLAKKNKLSADQLGCLKSCGFVLDPLAEAFQHSVDQLRRFIHQKKKWPASSSSDPNEKKLGKFCERQRQAYKKGKLSKDRIALLDEIGFKW